MVLLVRLTLPLLWQHFIALAYSYRHRNIERTISPCISIDSGWCHNVTMSHVTLQPSSLLFRVFYQSHGFLISGGRARMDWRRIHLGDFKFAVRQAELLPGWCRGRALQTLTCTDTPDTPDMIWPWYINFSTLHLHIYARRFYLIKLIITKL